MRVAANHVKPNAGAIWAIFGLHCREWNILENYHIARMQWKNLDVLCIGV